MPELQFKSQNKQCGKMELKNQTETTVQLNIFGDIVSDEWGKWSDEDTCPQDIADFLKDLGNTDEAELLRSYLHQIELYDATNREGHAAKVYFNALFGMDFTRSEENIINAALNYGYSIILSAFNREIVAEGYLTQLGIFHDNMFNHFNLSCDLMEPFRILIDRKVKSLKLTDFTSEEKYILVNTLNETVVINQSRQTTLNAIKHYCRSVFDALNEGDLSLIQFYSL